METGQPGVTRRLAGIRPVVRGLQMNGNVLGTIGVTLLRDIVNAPGGLTGRCIGLFR